MGYMYGMNRAGIRMYAVVVTWNNYEDTRRCLLSLLPYKRQGLNVVLVDNGSTDKSGEKLAQEFPWVTVISSKRNLGFAAGCNRGIAYALSEGADCVLLINNDAILPQGSLEAAVEALFSRRNIGVVGGKVLLWDSGTDNRRDNPKIDSVGVDRIFWPICRARSKGTGKLDKGQFEIRREVVAVKGALMLVKSEVFHTVGLLSEAYFLGGEDLDFCLKARRKGFIVLYEPKFVAWHKAGSSHSEITPAYAYNNVVFKHILMKTHLRQPYRWLCLRMFRFYVRLWYMPRLLAKIRHSPLSLQERLHLAQCLRDALAAALIDATDKMAVTPNDWVKWTEAALSWGKQAKVQTVQDTLNPRVSVVIPSFNRAASLCTILASYINQKHVAEIIVVDDGSTEDYITRLRPIAEEAKKLGKRFVLIRIDSRKGAAAARNVGIENSSGDFLLFSDDDILLCDDFVERAVQKLAELSADILGGRVIPPERARANERRRVFNWLTLRGYFDVDTGEAVELPFVSAVALWRRWIFESGVRFDEGYRGNGYREETSAQIFASRLGARIVYSPDLLAWHLRPKGRSGQWRGSRLWWYFWAVRNNYRFLKKEYGFLRDKWRLYYPWWVSWAAFCFSQLTVFVPDRLKWIIQKLTVSIARIFTERQL